MLKKLALFFIVLFLCVGGLEWQQRKAPPTRWQRVSDFELVEGVPVWRSHMPEATDVENASCAGEEGADVVLLGDSIFFGVMLQPEDTLALSLGRTLDDGRGESACTVNLSIPGFTFESEVAALKRDWERLKPRVVVLEMWHNSPHRMRNLGGVLFNFGSLVVDDECVPNPFGVTSLLNR